MRKSLDKLKSSDNNNNFGNIAERFIKSIGEFLMVQETLEKIAFPVLGKIGNFLVRKGATALFWNTWTKKFKAEDVEEAFGKSGEDLEKILGKSVTSGGSIDSSVVFSGLVRNPEFGETAVKVLGLAEDEMFGGVASAASKFATLAKFFEGASDIFDPVQWVLLVMMIVGMIFDAMDPCDTTGAITYDQFNTFGEKFNQNYRTTALLQLGAKYDQNGILQFSKWPVSYSPSSPGGVLDMYTKYEKAEKNLEMALMAYYLDTLQTNSKGENIIWNRNYKRNQKDMINGMQRAFNSVAINFANNNRVVAIGIERFWPLILLGFIILIIIILVLINE
ncbi:MAG: hypothetical protein CME61_09710 [Halobacteriovoraceae bacterium]|nr:hypothetical protein [Halobacteriovoraceae bacterium]